MDLQYLHAGSCMEVGCAIPKSECWHMLTSSAFAGAWAHPRCNRWDHVTQQIRRSVVAVFQKSLSPTMKSRLRRCKRWKSQLTKSSKSQAVRGTHVPAWLTNHVWPFSGLLISIDIYWISEFCYFQLLQVFHSLESLVCWVIVFSQFSAAGDPWGIQQTGVFLFERILKLEDETSPWKPGRMWTLPPATHNSNLERLTFILWCSCILHLGISMLKLAPAPYSLHNTTTSGSQILQGCSICTCCIMWQHFIISLSISLRWSNRLLRYVRSKDMGFQLIHHQDLSVTWLTTDRNIPRQSKETKQSKVGDFDFQMKTEFRGRSKQKRFWGTDVETWPPSTEWAVFQPQCTEIEPVETVERVEILWLLLNIYIYRYI